MNRVPLIVFSLLLLLLAIPLLNGEDPSEIKSVMVGKPLPAFSLPGAMRGEEGFSDKSLLGTPAIINVFASWCVSCEIEQGMLESISESEDIPVYGIDYKDTPEKLAVWLKEQGDPYTEIGADPAGRTAIDLGVYGVPETFLVDARGIIRYKFVGVVTDEAYQNIFKPLLDEMRR